VEILRNLRLGTIDVLVGVNLLREGLDLPEVSLVAIMDADKEGFLRSQTSLVQTIGRAARNDRGLVIMYADRITESMRLTIEETNRRRAKQEAYNKMHGITPTTVRKSKDEIFKQTSVADAKSGDVDMHVHGRYEITTPEMGLAADPIISYMDKDALKKAIARTEKDMLRAAKEMEYMEAARLRDELEVLRVKLSEIA
jgi:excinuclease ABC subunit B